MPILLTAMFWLVVIVHGEVRHQAGPMTADACALQMAFRILQVERVAAEGMRMVIDGREVRREDVEIGCWRGEMPS